MLHDLIKLLTPAIKASRRQGSGTNWTLSPSYCLYILHEILNGNQGPAQHLVEKSPKSPKPVLLYLLEVALLTSWAAEYSGGPQAPIGGPLDFLRVSSILTLSFLGEAPLNIFPSPQPLHIRTDL